MQQYYDGTEVLSMQDLDGNKPEIIMVTSNKTGGKTTYFSRLCVNKFKKAKSKFMLLYRFNYELDDICDKFFKDIKSLFFCNDTMTSKERCRGIYHELFLNDEPCGYAIALNNADQIKKMSHLFSDTDRMFMDEFQSETNRYCTDEVKKFRAIHTAVARGQGKQVRFVPVYMCANPVTILNPYFVAMGISDRLRDDTRFLRGHGFILEQGFVKSASEAQKQSAFNRAFGDDDFNAYQGQAVYLNDSKAFVEKPTGEGKYIATLKYKGQLYSIKEYPELGYLYCDDKADATFKYKLSVTTEDHAVNFVMLRRNDFFITTMRYFFQHGAFRFKNLRCKEVILNILAY